MLPCGRPGTWLHLSQSLACVIRVARNRVGHTSLAQLVCGRRATRSTDTWMGATHTCPNQELISMWQVWSYHIRLCRRDKHLRYVTVIVRRHRFLTEAVVASCGGNAPFVDDIVARTGEPARPFRWAAIEPAWRSTLATIPALTSDGSEVTL